MSPYRTFIAVVVGLSAAGTARLVDAQNTPRSLASAVVVTPVHPAGPTPAVARYHFEPAIIDRGMLKAISDNRVEPVTAVNLNEKVAAGALFVNRTAVVKEPPPPALGPPPHAASPGSPGVRLGFQLVEKKAVTGEPVRFAAYVADGTGLLLDAPRSAYSGTFYVALSNLENPADKDRLDRPVEIRIGAEGASEISPKPLTIDALGSWKDVAIVVPNPGGTVYTVTASADPQDRGDKVDLAVHNPHVSLNAAQDSIVGWGIGVTDITVVASGMLSSTGYVLPLKREHGGLAPGSVTLNANGVGTVTLRSDSAASTSVGIADPHVVSTPIQIYFRSPFGFLATAILGGLLGAFVRKKGRERWAVALLIGAASAVIMTLAYAVGVDWVSKAVSGTLAKSGEAVVFVLGALAALLGASTLVPTGQADG